MNVVRPNIPSSIVPIAPLDKGDDCKGGCCFSLTIQPAISVRTKDAESDDTDTTYRICVTDTIVVHI